MESAVAGSLELVVFPWLAFGHMIPFLELSKRLAAKGHPVAFVSTPRNIARLPPVPADLSSRLRFVPLSLPTVDGLPDGAESTADVPPEKVYLVKTAMDGLAAPFAAFLAGIVAAGSKPDWIIHDFCHHWLSPIADEHKVSCARFFITTASFAAFIGPQWANTAHQRTELEDFTVPPRWFSFPSTLAFRRHEAEWIADAFQINSSGISDIDRVWRTEHCRLTINRSCNELEPRMFALLTDLLEKPALPASVLFPLDINDASHGEHESSPGVVRSEVLQWLDNQPPKSVIYVALGSEAPLTTKNFHELALGLELAGVRFMWALRKPASLFSADNTGAGARGVLPDGFEERTRGCGLVWTGWVPQVKVLAHAAVGAFLTHCGWGSTIESFMFGHPLVMLPFVVDQPLIARMMTEKGIGVEIARDESDGSFDRDGVAAAVRHVMVEEEGKVLAMNAKKLQVILADQERQEKYIDDLVEHLRRCKH